MECASLDERLRDARPTFHAALGRIGRLPPAYKSQFDRG